MNLMKEILNNELRISYMEKCIINIKEHKLSASCLELLRKIIETFKIQVDDMNKHEVVRSTIISHLYKEKIC